MDRRSYLAGSTVSVVTLLSGCLGTIGVGTGGNDVAVPEDEDRVNAEIRGAVGALNRAGLSLHGVSEDLQEPNTVEYDPQRPRERIETAYDHLEAAEETGDRLEDIETLNEFADILERTIDVTVSLTDVDHEAEHEKAETALEEERYDDARSIVGHRNSVVTNDRERLAPAQETLAIIDRARFEDLNVIDVEQIDTGIDELDSILEGLDALTESFGLLINGSERLEDGRALFDDNDFETARVEFEDAEDDFADSSTTLEAVDNPPDTLTDEFETTACRSGHLEAAASELVAATDAALEGDVFVAEDHKEEAERLIENAENC
ncbi:hypothetical protein ACYJ1Y_10900 [Natrialbaceae archaeon A-gly3]